MSPQYQNDFAAKGENYVALMCCFGYATQSRKEIGENQRNYLCGLSLLGVALPFVYLASPFHLQ